MAAVKRHLVQTHPGADATKCMQPHASWMLHGWGALALPEHFGKCSRAFGNEVWTIRSPAGSLQTEDRPCMIKFLQHRTAEPHLDHISVYDTFHEVCIACFKVKGTL
jgi:hypothetical protein